MAPEPLGAPAAWIRFAGEGPGGLQQRVPAPHGRRLIRRSADPHPGPERRPAGRGRGFWGGGGMVSGGAAVQRGELGIFGWGVGVPKIWPSSGPSGCCVCL